jgi:hypothetical protein
MRRIAIALLITACSESEDPSGIPEPEPVVDWVTLECDPIAPAYCGHPFPSNVFTVADSSTPTGRRVQLSDAMMPSTRSGNVAMASRWSSRDGFSPGSGPMVHLPGATDDGLPTAFTIERSVADDSPTILLDAETGERVPHFAELDATATDRSRAVLFVRPARRLADARRYIVALRGVLGEDGEPLPASEAFAALRDRTEMPEIDERRPLYADIFARLTEAGVERGEVQLAWDFTTASEANNTQWLVHMRDEGLAMAGDAPRFEITSAENDFDPRVAWKIEGTFEVPLYLDVPGPVSVMSFGADGLPEPTRTESFAFELLIPASASESPAALLQFGHGLLGTREEIESDHFLDFIDRYHYAIFSTDWIGLSEPDSPFLGVILDSGRIEDYDGAFARTMQAMLNALVLQRVIANGVAHDPAYASMLDPSERYYYGISLGGILGTLYMTLSPDVQRGALDVMGTPFGLLLARSAAFDSFFDIALAAYEDPRDLQLALALVQLFWDRAEPIGFLPQLVAQTQQQVMMRAAIGDHAVPTIGAHVLARSLSAPHVGSGLREVYGLTSVDAADGRGYFEYDFGLPPEPTCALPMRACNNPHGALRGLPEADRQLDDFLRTGRIENPCPLGNCSFPELGDCPPEPYVDPCVE